MEQRLLSVLNKPLSSDEIQYILNLPKNTETIKRLNATLNNLVRKGLIKKVKVVDVSTGLFVNKYIRINAHQKLYLETGDFKHEKDVPS